MNGLDARLHLFLNELGRSSGLGKMSRAKEGGCLARNSKPQ